jgi:hypothetical protein
MIVAHYGHLVLKMTSPNGIIKVHGDRTTGAFTLEKLLDNEDIPMKVIQIGMNAT